jgi:hypothetical protein
MDLTVTRLEDQLGDLVAIIATHLRQEFPHKPGHVWADAGEVERPRDAAPAFHGSFDWHSSVHSHWALARALIMAPAASWATETAALLAPSFSAPALEGERRALDQSHRRGFEMPYGIAWLLALESELHALARALPAAAGWAAAIEPLATLAGDRFREWLERLPAPIRSGEHSSSAFAMALALDASEARGHGDRAAAICERAVAFHGADRDAPIAYEPSAYDFLSPTLAEADLMRRVLDGEFAAWLDRFLPETLALAPVTTADRVDGKLAHWDGLDLSRAWMLADVAAALEPGERRRALEDSSREHLAAGLAGLAAASYAGTHWLPTFAIRAICSFRPGDEPT